MITSPTDPFTLPLFPWKNNSCWFDLSLHILRVIFHGPALKDFEALCDNVLDSGLRSILFPAIYRPTLLSADHNVQTLRTEMESIRDSARRELKNQQLIKNLTSFETLLVSIGYRKNGSITY